MSVSDTCSKVCTWVFIRISMVLHVLSASTSADVTVSREACHLHRCGLVRLASKCVYLIRVVKSVREYSLEFLWYSMSSVLQRQQM